MYQDKTPSPASSSDSDPKAKLKMKITQMLEQRRGGNKMASPASASTSAPSKDALPIDESDTDIAKMEDVDHADGDDALSSAQNLFRPAHQHQQQQLHGLWSVQVHLVGCKVWYRSPTSQDCGHTLVRLRLNISQDYWPSYL